MKRRVYKINTHPYEIGEKKKYMRWLMKELRLNKLPEEIVSRDYFELYSYLLDKEYRYNGLVAWYDQNLYEDGMYLREIYVKETGNGLDTTWCSVFDIFAYLILYTSFGDMCGFSPRTHVGYLKKENVGRWHPEALFFEMLMNMGLDYFEEAYFDEYQVDFVLDKWLNREFRANGWGSPWPLDDFDGTEYAGVTINDCRDMSFGQMSAIYANENTERFKEALYSDLPFYDVFRFKKQIIGYHFTLEKAIKIKRRNAYGLNVKMKSW